MTYDITPVAVAITSTKTARIVTVPAGRRSARVESRLKSFGYAIQLNLFSDEN